MACLNSQGSFNDTSCFPCHVYNQITIEHTTPLIGCINCCLKNPFLDQLIQALLQRLKQRVFLSLMSCVESDKTYISQKCRQKYLLMVNLGKLLE